MYSTQPLKVASLADLAVDLQAMGYDLSRYAQNRDPSLIKEVPGKSVTWFHVSRIDTMTFENSVQNSATEHERFVRSFRYGVRRIDNFVTVDGEELKTFLPTGKYASSTGQVEYFTDQELAKVSPAFLEEIGSVCWTRSFLAHTSVDCYQLPPTLLVALHQRLKTDLRSFLDAVSKEVKDSSRNRAERRAKASKKGGDNPTAATATGSPTPSPAGKDRTTRRKTSGSPSKELPGKPPKRARGKRSKTQLSETS